MQLSAFSVSENVPASHCTQVDATSFVPGLHAPQYPSDAPPQLLRGAPPGHVSRAQILQLGALRVVEKLGLSPESEHTWQERSDVPVPAPETDSPAE